MCKVKCIHCGNMLKDGEAFCGKCGSRQEIAGAAESFGFRTAMSLDDSGSEAAMEPAPAVKKEGKNSFRFETETPKATPASRPVAEEPRRPYSPSAPREKTPNYRLLGLVAMLVLVIGIFAIADGFLFDGSDSGSSRRKKSRNDSYYDSYQYYDDGYSYDDYYEYNDYYGDFGGGSSYDSGFDCPACTGGRHDLCNGSGIYRNYGQEVECSCDDGRCTICGGSGWID